MIFEAWCRQNGAAMVPASPDEVAAFVTDRSRKDSPPTLKRRLAAIRKLHKLLRASNPVEDEEVRIALRRARRAKPWRPRQALGITREVRRALIETCAGPDPEALCAVSSTTIRATRDAAMLAVGYDTLCRRSELVALRLEDLSQLPSGGMSVLVRRSKNDPFGQGRLAYLSADTAQQLSRWIAAGGIDDGPIFRAVPARRDGTSGLHPGAVSRTLKRRAVAAGLADETAQISGHSLRVGAAQDMAAADFGLPAIMQAGGWRSPEMVARYVERARMEAVGERRALWSR